MIERAATGEGMRAREAGLLLAALIFIGAAPPSSPPRKPAVDAQMVTFGVYRDAADPNAEIPVELAGQITTFEACPGANFGYQLLISGLDPGSHATFRKVVKHPPMHKPEGGTSRGYEKPSAAEVAGDGTVSTYQGFALDHDYERVPGRWDIEFWYGSQMLASKTFTLLPCTTR